MENMIALYIVMGGLFFGCALVVAMAIDDFSRPSYRSSEAWFQPHSRILHTSYSAFEFGGFPNESTLLFYERRTGRNARTYPFYFQIQKGKELEMTMYGKMLVVTDVDMANNRIKMKIT